jgi:hypothetical protein
VDGNRNKGILILKGGWKAVGAAAAARRGDYIERLAGKRA